MLNQNAESLKGHYTKTLLEPIEVMILTCDAHEVEGFIKGNIIKYSMRGNFKGQLKDDKVKLDWYTRLLIYFEEYGWEELLDNYKDFKENYVYHGD